MKRISHSFALCLVMGISVSRLFSQDITIASDNASNYPPGGLNNGSNGGTGFNPWNVWSSGGTGGFGGYFVGNPAAAGISGMSSNSFGLYAKQSSGAYANTERRFNNSLAVGQTLSFQWSINWDSGAEGKGVDIYSGSSKILNIQNGGSSDIFCNGSNIGFAYGTGAMTWSFSRTAVNTISVSANGRNGFDSFSTNIVVADGAIDRLVFYAYNLQNGDEAQPYFNNLLVTEPVASSMAVPGNHAFAGTWQPDGRSGTGMTRSSNPATPNLWELVFNVVDAKPISFQFAANGSWDFSWGNDPARPGYAKRGGAPISFAIPATGAYKFTFDQSTLAYSITRVDKSSFGTYQKFADFYYLTGGASDDFDKDGLTNTQEYDLNTDPTNRDSDGDTLADSAEVNAAAATNPLSSDSDNDGLPDWWEVAQGLNPNSSSGMDGTLGDPDSDGFNNKVEFEGQSNPLSAASVPANRSVTFTLDLNRQIAAGSFVATGSTVEVWGTFNDWGNFTNKYGLTNNGSGTYSGTFVVPGAAGSTNRYKFVTLDSSNTLSWEPGSDRVLVMGASGVATNLPVAYLGEVRPVTYSVNMAVQGQLGNFTVGGTNKVFVVGTDIPGGWDLGTELTRVGTSDVYSGTVWITGKEGGTSNFKFKAGNALGYEDGTLLGTDTRVLTLGARDQAQTNSEVYFNNANGVRLVTFSVNMNVQTNTNKLSFNPAADNVEVRGTFNNFGGGTNWRLTNNGSGIFTGSFTIPGSEGVTNAFKYVALVGSNVAFERVDIPRANSLLNRTFVFGPSGTPQDVHSVASPALFSQDDGIGPVITLKGLDPISLNVGDSFVDPGATVSDLLEGVGADIMGTGTVNTAVVGTYTLTYNAADAASNQATPVMRAVVVKSTGSSFAGWLGSSTPSAELLQQYAFGAPSAANPVNESNLPTGGANGSDLVLTYYVRQEATNPYLVIPQLSSDLADSNSWSTNGITHANLGTNSVDGVSVVKKTASVPIDSTNRKFLRLKLSE